METLNCQFQWLKSGLLSSVVSIPVQVILNAQLAQKMSLGQKMVNNFHGMMLDDRNLKVCELAEAVGRHLN